MLHSQLLKFIRSDVSKFMYLGSSNLHTSSFLNIKGLSRRRSDKSCDPPKIAIILSGCGYLDGSEISECISATIHISEKGMIPVFFAPDADICEVIDHYTKEPDNSCSQRNALVESARLARSCIQPLCDCEACNFGALIIPGGFGAVRTLSDFATKGCDCTVIPDLEKLIQDFSCEKKPIGTICIAGVLVARVLEGVKVTLGKDCSPDEWPYAEAIQIIRQMGAKVDMKDVKGVTKCKKYNVFSTPAWMYKPATYCDIHTAIGKLITMLKKCIRQ
ncbi:glutamine amidotransferase-like class 1 domain-containing protein 3A, mitochondrial [Vespula pensylvanica]|uniref:glutamine amidotransferase-like class 1 domain-containing protein 3A, mitochondrial n=1 Tax=Vespula pensylvanica TaxID=30213 RepID=UPI001CBA4044|nr:glutamine amidotransferase-like class 1 domain-containing protein 3A, mitochondrial [Vespula pensylvanica]